MAIKKIDIGGGLFKWEVRVYVEGRGGGTLRRRFDKKIEAQNFLEGYEKHQENMNPVSGKNSWERPFAEELSDWYYDSKNLFSPGHLARVKGILKTLEVKFQNLAVKDVTAQRLARLQDDIVSSGLSHASANRTIEVVLATLNYAVKQRRIPYNPSEGFRKFRRTKTEMQFLTAEEALSFLDFANTKYPPASENRKYYVVYLLALNTGLRAGEIWGLRPSDFRREARTLFVQRQFNRVSKEFTETKGRGFRLVPLNQELIQELQILIDQAPGAGTIFRNRSGLEICHDNFKNRVFESDLKQWGGKSIRFHDLRHTAATLMIRSGVDVRTVKEVLGHGDVSTTMGYLHVVPGYLEKFSESFSLTLSKKEVRKF